MAVAGKLAAPPSAPLLPKFLRSYWSRNCCSWGCSSLGRSRWAFPPHTIIFSVLWPTRRFRSLPTSETRGVSGDSDRSIRILLTVTNNPSRFSHAQACGGVTPAVAGAVETIPGAAGSCVELPAAAVLATEENIFFRYCCCFGRCCPYNARLRYTPSLLPGL